MGKKLPTSASKLFHIGKGKASYADIFSISRRETCISRRETCISRPETCVSRPETENISARDNFYIRLCRSLFPYILLFAAIAFTACDDEIPRENGGDTPTETSVSGMYILCEGLFNTNNSTLSYYDFRKGEMVSFQDEDKRGDDKTSYDFFKMQNGRKLGDTANDLQRYGSKLWCAVNVSSQIEVMDVATGKSLRQIPLFNESGVGRQPRYFAFHQDKAYICNFDGTVARIDTASLAIDGIVKAGRNPDGICAANGKLYVSNSGGLDTSNPDKTVSVIDIETFTETKRIELRENPGTILADAYGNVYAVSRGKYDESKSDYDCRLHRINSETDKVIADYDLPVLSFTVSGTKAYLYSYESGEDAIPVMDTRTGQIIDDNFIKDGSRFTHIYNIAANPSNGDVYICDAQNYTVNGLVYCFGKDGKRKFTLDAKGLNPNSLVFTELPYQELPDDPNGGGTSSNCISKVFDYMPAAGQFVNKMPTYQAGDDAASMCAKCLDYFDNGYLVSLGGFGGYITVGFDSPIANHPGEYDFCILGNGFDGSAEPGVVLVSKDTNANGIPDDEWYELKGSEHDNPLTLHDYEITYYKPEAETDKVRWTDNRGAEGYIERTIHEQSYYPAWVATPTLTFRGSRLPDNGVFDISLNKWVMSSYTYGYADNHSNAGDGSKFKIDWAIDRNGSPVSLDQIDFIRIYTAVNQQIPTGAIGELSTEIQGIERLAIE